MTKQEALTQLTPKMGEYLTELRTLTDAVFKINRNPKPYIKGVKDGVENTALIAFNAGAKAMYDLLTKKENETSNNV